MGMVEKWAEAFNSSDVPRLLSCYTDDAVLVPTLSTKILLSKHEMAHYFVGLMMIKGVKVEVNSVVRRGNTESGFYTFKMECETDVVARFTFVGRGRKILTQHSSTLP